MNATNRKIDNKADPANDPAMAALRPNNRMQVLMAEIRQDNPIAKPDRPHTPVTDLRTATRLDLQREELQRAISTEAVEQTIAASPVAPQTASGEPVLASTPVQEVEAKVEAPQEATPKVEEVVLPSQTVLDQPAQFSENLPVNDAAVHTDNAQTKPRLRGRPRVGDERKRESSYTLSPHITDRIRDLAALEQIRLKRTVSASEIAERMIEMAEQQIEDNKVLLS